MRVGLFIPCYVDQLFPRVGLATVDLLERLGVEVDFPEEQTCCGQPLANGGDARGAARLAERFLDVFDSYEAVVAPSGSCVAMVRHHFGDLLAERDLPRVAEVGARTYELCEFLHDVLELPDDLGRPFPHRVGLHKGCHGLRELRLGRSTERIEGSYDKVRRLLDACEDLELVDLDRPDECCGFGGTFAVTEEAISCLMGRDRLADHADAGAEVVTSVDASCLMHLDGLIRRDGRRLVVKHVAEILAGGEYATL